MRLLSLALLIITLGCSKQAPVAPPASSPAPAPVAAMPERPGAASAISGKVLETLEAPSYTYLRLSTASGEQWAAIPTAPVPVGTEVTLANPTVMTNFVSKTLNRTFPEIFFSTGVEQKKGATPHDTAHPAPVAAADPQAAALAAWAEKADPVARATGPDAKTIAEVYLQKAALTDKPVLVRGKVVKYTAGVMGKNWIHLRDGTGKPESKDNDLTVTTADQAAVGEVVSVRGPVHVDRDFGAGYVFPVMIEDAKVVR